MNIRPYKQSDQNDVIGLLREVFPSAPARNDPLEDIEIQLTEQPELFLVAIVDGLLVSTAMAGFDGHPLMGGLIGGIESFVFIVFQGWRARNSFRSG